jgi:replicative DNA helicase
LSNIPHSKDAEQAILACCLIGESDKVFEQVSSQISTQDFYDEAHQDVWNGMSELSSESVAIDVVTLAEKVKHQAHFICELSNKITTTISLNHYIDILLEKSKLRAMRRQYSLALERIELDAKPDSIEETVNKELESFKPRQKENTHIKSSLDIIKDDYEKVALGEYKHDYVKTHIPHLDEKIKLELGTVFTIAAPTSVGKSALSLNIALRSAKKDLYSSLIFSLEMPQKQLTKRLIGAMSKVNLNRLEEGVASDSDTKKVNKAISTLENLPIHTIHSVKDIRKLASDVKRYKKDKDIKLVIIDYLQLIPFDSGRMGKADGIAMISQKIKQIALENNVAIILLSQLNREGARSEFPDLYHLKDSGSIENDADIVLIMNCKDNNPEAAQSTDDHGPYISINYLIAKNREGERGVRGKFKFYACKGIFL